MRIRLVYLPSYPDTGVFPVLSGLDLLDPALCMKQDETFITRVQSCIDLGHIKIGWMEHEAATQTTKEDMEDTKQIRILMTRRSHQTLVIQEYVEISGKTHCHPLVGYCWPISPHLAFDMQFMT